jgi:phenylalanyl-tRNA synthetase alpha chain
MSELAQLETTILTAIAAAADEAALEAVRVGALGKKGSISEKMKTLGAMSQEERQAMGPLLNGLKDKVAQALSERRNALRMAAIAERLRHETVDVTLPVRQAPAEAGRIHPISQVIDEMTGRMSRPTTTISPR